MIKKGEKVKILDFGLGIFIENDLISRITKTGEHAVGGLFTAPELVQNPKLIDKRSDIYSLGAIWYNSIVGIPPAGSNLKENIMELPVNSFYKNMLSKCLDDLENRYSNIGELLKDIELYEKNDEFAQPNNEPDS